MSAPLIVCPRCSSQNPPSFQFCGNCGESLIQLGPSSLPLPPGSYRSHQQTYFPQPGAYVDEGEQFLARTKSFTYQAVLTLVLYFILYLPGLLANVLFYSEARRAERIAGRSLPGVGCLLIMLWFNIVWIALGILGFCATCVLLTGGMEFIDSLLAPPTPIRRLPTPRSGLPPAGGALVWLLWYLLP